jgi:hypothetical protein
MQLRRQQMRQVTLHLLSLLPRPLQQVQPLWMQLKALKQNLHLTALIKVQM